MTVSFHNAPIVTETVRTTAAVATELLRWVPDLDSASIVRLTVNGTATSGDVVSVVRTWSVIRSDAGTVVAALSAEKRFDSGSATWVVDLAVDGGDGISAVCSVTGAAAHDITWTGVAVALNGSREIVRYWSYKSVLLQAGEYIDCGDNLDRDILEPWSVSAWVKRGDASQGTIASKHAGGATAGYYFTFEANGSISLTIKDDAGNTIEAVTPAGSVPVGTWTHLVGTYSAATQTHADLAIYVNASSSVSGTFPDTLTGASTNAASFKIGGNVPYNFVGNIDDVSFYTDDLSGAEVTWIYNGKKPRNPADAGAPGDLAGHWRCGDEDTYPTVTDYGPSGFHGTLTGTEGDEFVEDAP